MPTQEKKPTTSDISSTFGVSDAKSQQFLSAFQGGTITSESLTPTTSFNLPPPSQGTEAAGFEGAMDAFSKGLQVEADKTKVVKDQSGRDYASALFGAEGETALTDKLYSETVDPAESELSDINQQLLEEQEGLRRQIERIEDNAEGLETSGVAGRVDEARRKSLRTQADLAVIQMAKQGKYDSAKKIADRAVAVQLEKQRQTLDTLQFIYQENKEAFTRAEQRAFEVAHGDRERALNAEEDNLKTISDLSLNALQNGAPTDLASQMRQAKTVEQAMQIGGQYVDRLDRQLKIAQINKIGLDNLIAEAQASDRKNGILNDKDIKNIDASPQGKQLTTAANLKLKLSSYQDLVTKYGFEMAGPKKAVLENAYTELQLAYKEAANLGVLNGPDLGLVESAIRSATPGFFGNAGFG